MRTLVPILKSAQKSRAANSGRPGWTSSGQSREVRSILHGGARTIQRTPAAGEPGDAKTPFLYNVEDEDRPYETGVPGGLPQIAAVPAGRLQRTATWAAGTERRNWDAADRTMNAGGNFGFTPPTLNASIILNATAAGAAIQAPTKTVRTIPASGTGAPTAEASFVANATNTASYQLDSLDAGPHSVASTQAAVAARCTALGLTPPAQCVGTGPTTFGINGQPDNATHSAAILAHERHHAADHQREFGNVIGTWNNAIDAAITARTVYNGPDAATAEANMWAAVGGTPSQVATRQHNAWMTANNNYHGSPAGRAKRPHNPQADATCANSSMDHTA